MTRSAVLLAAAALSAAAASPALAATEGPASGICIVKNVAGVKPAPLKIGVNIGEASSKAAVAKAECSVVATTVRALAKTRAEKPVKVNGYACTPSVTKNTKIQWSCVWKGGSPKTTVELLFPWRYV